MSVKFYNKLNFSEGDTKVLGELLDADIVIRFADVLIAEDRNNLILPANYNSFANSISSNDLNVVVINSQYAFGGFGVDLVGVLQTIVFGAVYYIKENALDIVIGYLMGKLFDGLLLCHRKEHNFIGDCLTIVGADKKIEFILPKNLEKNDIKLALSTLQTTFKKLSRNGKCIYNKENNNWIMF